MKRWQLRPSCGAAVNDSAVMALCSRAKGSHPERWVIGGRTIVTYRRTRFYLDRAAWESLPPDGVLVMFVHLPNGPQHVFAMTRTELDSVFGEVRQTNSWNTVRCYHFPSIPPAAWSFLVAMKDDLQPASGVACDSAADQVPLTTIATHSDFTRSVTDIPASLSARASIDEWAGYWARHTSTAPESPTYLHAVRAWRNVWRPKQTRVLLIAESHVAEQPGDHAVRVRLPFTIPERLPDRYVRLVYCLGYGENELCQPVPDKNGGTWQYWDILGQIAHGLGHLQPRKPASLSHRLEWKLSVLHKLRETGVWLVDASVIALYVPSGGRRYSAEIYTRVVRDSFKRFVLPEIGSDEIRQAWVIGHGVGRALAGLPLIDFSRVISQPQDRDAGRYRSGLARLVHAIRGSC
jgi:hypothetical protein